MLVLALVAACTPVTTEETADTGDTDGFEDPFAIELVEAPEVDEAMAALVEARGIVGLAVGIAEGDTIVYLQGFGYEDREADIAVDPRTTMFRWASLSKGITGVLSVVAEADGDLDLDAPISDAYTDYEQPDTYLPGDCTSASCAEALPEDAPAVTQRMLLSHFAGAQHYSNGTTNPVPASAFANDPEVNTGMEWALPLWVTAPLVDVPGNSHSYSTFGHNLAGVVVEQAVGSSFADQTAERVAQPLGMTTLQPDYQWVDIEHRSAGYINGPDEPDRQPLDNDVSWKLAGGGFISTVEDLTRFCAGLNASLLMPDDLRDDVLWQPYDSSTSNYALGFGAGSEDGERRISHTGAQEKTRTALIAYPDSGLCVVIMTNSEWVSPSNIANNATVAWRSRE